MFDVVVIGGLMLLLSVVARLVPQLRKISHAQVARLR